MALSPRGAALLLGAWLGVACASGPVPGPPRQPPLAERLLVPPDSAAIRSRPDLADRLHAEPHAYFRFVNTRFARLVCEWYAPRFVARRPGGRPLEVTLHGDAHVEQYAVTDSGRGLTDFDDSSRGPAVVDLLRFGTSLRLTARANGWEDAEDELFAALLEGYRHALRNPGETPAEPSFVPRIRTSVEADRLAYLGWAESLMEPVAPEVEAEVRRALRTLVDNLVAPESKVAATYFEAVRIGRLGLGVGSALDPKYLVRLRGPSDDPSDDDVLELKQVRELEGIPCLEARPGDPHRVLLGESRMAYTPLRLLGYVRLQGRYYWTHGWAIGYREVEARGTLRSAAELGELARDAGVQLGLGHPRGIPEPLARRHREAHVALVERREAELAQASRELAAAVLEAWRRFGAAPSPGSGDDGGGEN